MSYQPPFLSFQGFLELIQPLDLPERIDSFYMQGAVGDPQAPSDGSGPLVLEKGGTRSHSCIRLIDTFLDPECVNLKRILLRLSEIEGPAPRVQLLLMSPYAQIAAVRYEALRLARPTKYDARSPLHETNKRLHDLAAHLYRLLGRDAAELPRVDGSNHFDDMVTFEELVGVVSERGAELGFQLRFYDKYTDAPLYVFGRFVLKGVVLDRSAAEDNPWLAFVDDPNQSRDLYDLLVEKLDRLWDRAIALPSEFGLPAGSGERSLSALIAMRMAPEFDERHRAIQDACEALDVGPTVVARRIDEVQGVNKSINDKLVDEIRHCDILIADLSGARANVYYEVGLAQAMNKPVLLIIEGGETDAEFDLRNYPVHRFATDEQISDAVQNGLREIFDKLRLG